MSGLGVGWVAVCAAATAATVLLLLSPPPRWRGIDARSSDRSGGRLRLLLAGRRDVAVPPARRIGLGLAIGLLAALLLGRVVGPLAVLPAAGLAVGVAVGLGWLEPGAVVRRRWQSRLQTPQVLDLLAAGLRSGLPLRAATAAVVAACPGPVADELRRVLHQVTLGIAEPDAWKSLSGHPDLGALAVDLARSVESGTRLVAALEFHAAEARASRRSAIEVAARKVGVRSVLPLMTCFIPAFLLLGVVPTVASAILRVTLVP